MFLVSADPAPPFLHSTYVPRSLIVLSELSAAAYCLNSPQASSSSSGRGRRSAPPPCSPVRPPAAPPHSAPSERCGVARQTAGDLRGMRTPDAFSSPASGGPLPDVRENRYRYRNACAAHGPRPRPAPASPFTQRSWRLSSRPGGFWSCRQTPERSSSGGRGEGDDSFATARALACWRVHVWRVAWAGSASVCEAGAGGRPRLLRSRVSTGRRQQVFAE